MTKEQALRAAGRSSAPWLLIAALAAVGCSAGKAKTPELAGELTGPSTTGIGVQITVTPDVMFADGQSQATVTVTVSGPDGKPLANQVVYLFIGDDDLQVATYGQLSAAVVSTGADGKARATYTAPPAKDFAANARITIFARVAGTNAQTLGPGVGQFSTPFAKILLAAVDQRTWPQGSSVPSCSMVTDPRWGPWYTNRPIKFMSTATAAGAPIIQYLGRFGDDETKYFYGPDQVHTFKAPGDYQIFESVLDSDGHVDSCLFWHDGDLFMTIENP
jgi:hypothetical protein